MGTSAALLPFRDYRRANPLMESRMPKSKGRAFKARARLSRIQPVLVRADDVRRSKGRNVSAENSNTAPWAAMARLTTDYMAVPMLVAACRSPFDLWCLQARLAHQGLVGMQSMALGRPSIVPLPVP